MNKKLTLKRRGNPDALLEETVPTDSIVTVGNNPGSTIMLEENEIAAEQFLMVFEGDEFILMNRADGTVLNGDPLSLGARVALNDGDLLEVGSYEIFYGDPKPQSSSAPEVSARSAANGTSEAGTGTAAVKKLEKIEESEVEGSKAETARVEDPDERDFSKLLYELREEDTFYFHLRDKEGTIQRVPFENDEIWIGTRLGIVTVESSEDKIDEVFARVNKDWSGVVLYPRDDQKVLYDGKPLTEPMRLSNGNELVLVDDFEDVELETKIIFYEPVALMALNSILPGDLPEPVSSETNSVTEPAVSAPGSANAGSAIDGFGSPLIFGYFTLLEVLIMALGTIVTAAIIFFILEFV